MKYLKDLADFHLQSVLLFDLLHFIKEAPFISAC